MTRNIFIHPTSVVAEGSVIGNFTSIWHFSHIEKTAQIGENCNFGQNTYVGNNAKIGNACRIGNSVSIFSHVVLEDFVFCAPFMVFTHIGYPRAVVNRHQIFERTLVRRGATLGANCTVVPGVEVGEGAFIGAGAILTKSCKPWALLVGMPAKQIGWVSAFGDRIPLDLAGHGEWQCPHTGDTYVLNGENLIRHPSEIDILTYKAGEKFERRIIESEPHPVRT